MLLDEFIFSIKWNEIANAKILLQLNLVKQKDKETT